MKLSPIEHAISENYRQLQKIQCTHLYRQLTV